MKYFFFSFVGFCSTLTFVMLGILIFPGALKGDFAVVNEMWTKYPGSQPFIIVMLPMMFIASIAWVWRLTARLCSLIFTVPKSEENG